MVSVLRLAVLLIFCAAAPGCIMLPIPTGEHDSKDLPGRTNVKPELIQDIGVGRTTRAEVLLALGEPDGVFAEDRVFAYLWSRAAGYFFFAILAGPASGGSATTVGKGYILVIEFDDRGIVRRREVSAANNWTHWGGPGLGGVNFPSAMRDPASRPAR